MSAALARASALAKATVLELHGESAARRADCNAAALAKADAAAAVAQARVKDSKAAAAAAAMQSTVSEIHAVAETQRAQSANAKAAAAAAAAALSAVLSHRQTAAETAEVRIRELERALADAQAEVARLAATSDTDVISELQRQLRSVHEMLLSTETALSSREALLATTKRDHAAMVNRAAAEVAASAATRANFESQTRAVLDHAVAECRRALCAESAAVQKCSALEAELATQAAENARLQASLTTLRAAAKDAATERAAVLEALQQSAEACAVLQAELRGASA